MKVGRAGEQNIIKFVLVPFRRTRNLFLCPALASQSDLSFGERIFKIGMTRRLEPMDRVQELGDASVPFPFDLHVMLYSDNAPELEYALHKLVQDRTW